MTGLDPDNDVILEVATVITDPDLNIVGETQSMVLSQPAEKLAQMDSWNQQHHSQSGLLEQVSSSPISLAEAEASTYDLITRHTNRNQAPLCGNSIGQDRRFLQRYMPVVEDYLHYRNIDVSSIKELVRRWAPHLYQEVTSQKHTGAKRHRALDDIMASIRELQLYRTCFVAPEFRRSIDSVPK